MSSINLRHTCPARIVEGINAPDAAPGDVEVRAIDGVVWGYAFACPGCGGRSYLAVGDLDPGPRWSVTAGDIARPETVTLSPSILDTVERGGCGWHGYLRGGRFEPC